jgi:hypothetical protein
VLRKLGKPLPTLLLGRKIQFLNATRNKNYKLLRVEFSIFKQNQLTNGPAALPTFNHRVPGSSPGAPTIQSLQTARFRYDAK